MFVSSMLSIPFPASRDAWLDGRPPRKGLGFPKPHIYEESASYSRPQEGRDARSRDDTRGGCAWLWWHVAIVKISEVHKV